MTAPRKIPNVVTILIEIFVFTLIDTANSGMARCTHYMYCPIPSHLFPKTSYDACKIKPPLFTLFFLPFQFKCQMDCTKKNAECSRNHMCLRKCYETCGKCKFEEKKTPSNCDHVYKVECYVRPEDILCQRPCKKMLPCGHPCHLQCFDECGNCQEKVIHLSKFCLYGSL